MNKKQVAMAFYVTTLLPNAVTSTHLLRVPCLSRTSRNVEHQIFELEQGCYCVLN